jgi:hypothetical protein
MRESWNPTKGDIESGWRPTLRIPERATNRTNIVCASCRKVFRGGDVITQGSSAKASLANGDKWWHTECFR